ncbi:MAG: hypothetical protein O3A01_08005 [bacterium]|nr:hypothetical protein [bacterium]
MSVEAYNELVAGIQFDSDYDPNPVDDILNKAVSSGKSSQIKQIIDATDVTVVPKYRSEVYQLHIVPALCKSRNLEFIDLAATITLQKIRSSAQAITILHHIVPGYVRFGSTLGFNRAKDIANHYLNDDFRHVSYESYIIPGLARIGDQASILAAVELTFAQSPDPFTQNTVVCTTIIPEMVRHLEVEAIKVVLGVILKHTHMLPNIITIHLHKALLLSGNVAKREYAATVASPE